MQPLKIQTGIGFLEDQVSCKNECQLYIDCSSSLCHNAVLIGPKSAHWAMAAVVDMLIWLFSCSQDYSLENITGMIAQPQIVAF